MANNKDVAARVYRTLRPLKSFREIGADAGIMPNLHLADGDEVLGVYENAPDDHNRYIVVSVNGVYIDRDHGASWKFIPYKRMLRTTLAAADKHTIDRLTIDLSNDEPVVIVVSGGNDIFRDVFEVARFLDRVMPSRSTL